MARACRRSGSSGFHVVVGRDIAEDAPPGEVSAAQRLCICSIVIGQRLSGVRGKAHVDEGVETVGIEIYPAVAVVIVATSCLAEVAQPKIVDLSDHVKGKVPLDSFGIAASPIRKGDLRLALQDRPELRLDMLRRVRAKTINAIVSDPVGQPLHEMIFRGPWIAGAGEESVEFSHLLLEPAFRAPLLDQEGGDLDRSVAFRPEVLKREGKLAGGGACETLVGALLARADPLCRPARIPGTGDRSRVIEDDVHDHPQPAIVRGPDHLGQVRLASEAPVDLGEVARPVAVVGVGASPFSLEHAATDVLDQRSSPDRVDAQSVEVPFADALGDAADVAALKAAKHALRFSGGSLVVVGAIAIVKAIGQEKVDARIPPEG